MRTEIDTPSDNDPGKLNLLINFGSIRKASLSDSPRFNGKLVSANPSNTPNSEFQLEPTWTLWCLLKLTRKSH